MLEKIINQVGPKIDYLFYDYLVSAFYLLAIGGIIIMTIIIIKKRKKKDLSTSNEPRNNPRIIKEEQNMNSLKILKERLAKGEISKEEHSDLKKEFEKWKK